MSRKKGGAVISKVMLPVRIASVFVMCLAIMSCSPTGFANWVAPLSGIGIETDIAYGQGPRRKLDLYTPDRVADKSPAILFFYGGRWQFGSKSDYLFVAQALAARGFVTMVADYRLYPEVRWPGFVEDAHAALAKGAELTKGRPIVLAGHSAGAYLASMVALNDDKHADFGIDACSIAGLVGLAGPYDFLPIVEEDIKQIFGPGEATPETQPVNYVTLGDPPALLIHGSADSTVKPHNTLSLAEAMKTAGVPVDLEIVDGLGHIGLIASFSLPARFVSTALDDMTAFVRELPPRKGCTTG